MYLGMLLDLLQIHINTDSWSPRNSTNSMHISFVLFTRGHSCCNVITLLQNIFKDTCYAWGKYSTSEYFGWQLCYYTIFLKSDEHFFEQWSLVVKKYISLLNKNIYYMYMKGRILIDIINSTLSILLPYEMYRLTVQPAVDSLSAWISGPALLD